MILFRKGVLESAAARVGAALLASSLVIATTTARADQTSPPAPSTEAAPATAGGSVWGEGSDATTRKILVFSALGLAVVAGGIGLGFHVDAINKENQRQDFIKSNGNVDLSSGPGVAEVGPQCKGPVQCAQYTSIKNSRDDSYKVAVGFYAGASAALVTAGVYYLQVVIDHSAATKRTGFVPVLGPQTAGAAWEARF